MCILIFFAHLPSFATAIRESEELDRSGSKLYKQIPPNSFLYWKIELVELNFIKEGMNNKPREDSY